VRACLDGAVRPLLATFFFLSVVVDGRRRLVVAAVASALMIVECNASRIDAPIE